MLDQVGPDKACDLEKFFADVNAVLQESFSWLCGVPPFCYDDEFLEGYILGAPSSMDLFHEQIENDPGHLPGTLMYYGLEMIKVLLSAYQFALLTQAFEKKYLHSLKSRRESDFARVSNLCFQEDLTFASLICKMPYHPFVSYDPSPKLAMEFVTVKNPDDFRTPKLVNRISFSQLIDLLTYDLMNGMEHGHSPARCQNCKRYFLTTNARAPKYCDGQAPQNPAMTCRQYGAMHHQKEQN